MQSENHKNDEKAHLGLKPGTQLQVQLAEKKAVGLSSLIGKVPGQYLIVHTPTLMGFTLSQKKKDRIIVRYVHDGKVYGFKCTLLYFMDTPFRLSFLSYPQHIETMNLRSHERVSCFVPASMKIADNVYEGVIMNLSVTGCSFYYLYQNSEEEVFTKLAEGQEMTIGFALQLMDDSTELTLGAMIRNTRQDSQKITIGAEFMNIQPEAAGNVKNYIGRISAFKDIVELQ